MLRYYRSFAAEAASALAAVVATGGVVAGMCLAFVDGMC